MAINKETVIGKVEVVGTYKAVQVAIDTLVKEDGKVISQTSDQNGVPDNTWTKVNMNTEYFDSDGKYDTSTYRFTPTIAGKYMFGASLFMIQQVLWEQLKLVFTKMEQQFYMQVII
jgi:hypothetical protein